MNRPVSRDEAQRQLMAILKEAQHYAHLHGLNAYCTMVNPDQANGLLLLGHAQPAFIADAITWTLRQHPYRQQIMQRLDEHGMLEPEPGSQPLRSQQAADQPAVQAAELVDLPGHQPGRLSLTDHVLLAIPDILTFLGMSVVVGLSIVGLDTLLRP